MPSNTNKQNLLKLYRAALENNWVDEMPQILKLMREHGVYRNIEPDNRTDRFEGLSAAERVQRREWNQLQGRARQQAASGHHQPLIDLYNDTLSSDYTVELTDEITVCSQTAKAFLRCEATAVDGKLYSPEAAAAWQACSSCGTRHPDLVNGLCPDCRPSCFRCGSITSQRVHPLRVYHDEPATHVVCHSCRGGYFELGGEEGYAINRPQGRAFIMDWHRSPAPMDLHPTARWRVGFEVEKNYFQGSRTVGFKVGDFRFFKGFETDSSCGVEAISHIVGLGDQFYSEVEEMVKEANEVFESPCNSNCGGHINISRKGWDAARIFNEMKKYTGLLICLWPERFHEDYCGNGANPTLGSDHDCMFNGASGTRLEFRLPNRVKNAAILLRRYRFMSKVAEAIDNGYDVEQLCEQVRPIMMEMFEDEEKVEDRLQLAQKIQEAFDQGSRISPIVSEFVQNKHCTLV